MALALSPASAAAQRLPAAPWGPDAAKGNEFTPWIEIAADSTVTMRVPNPESGNGTMTQIAMNVAEELHCAWSDIRVDNASVHRDYVENHVYTKACCPSSAGMAPTRCAWRTACGWAPARASG